MTESATNLSLFLRENHYGSDPGDINDESHILFYFGSDNAVNISAQELLTYWERLGMSNAEEVLTDLGVKDMEEMIQKEKVDTFIREQIIQGIDIIRFPSVKAAMLTMLEECRILKTTVLQTKQDLTAMATQLQNAEERACVLAAEVDDDNLVRDRECMNTVEAIEQKYCEMLRDREREVQEELEGKENIIQDMQKIIYEERDNSVINENNYRNQIEILMREKESIQKKFEASESKLMEKEGLIKHMKKEITDRKTLMEKSPDIGITDLSENLVKKSEELSQLNKGLKDRNDELERKLQILSELSESQKCSNCQNGPMKDLKGEKEKQSCPLQDSGSVLINQVAMPGHVILDRSTMASDGKYLETIESLYDDSPHGSDVNENILHDNFLPCITNTLASSEAVSEKAIVPELDKIKQEIEKIISQKENINKENEVLKIYQDAFAELNGQNKILVEKVQKLEALNTTLRAESKSFPDLIIENDYQSIYDIQRSSPDGQEVDDEYQAISTTINDTEQKEIGCFQKKIEMLQVERDVLVREKDDILEKNKQLEEGLDLMGSEFESMEDYWQKKMNEERELYERQIKMNEIQFKDLEVKMKEYEDLLMTIEPKQQIEADRLSTIDEKRSLEEQVCITKSLDIIKLFFLGQYLGRRNFSTED